MAMMLAPGADVLPEVSKCISPVLSSLTRGSKHPVVPESDATRVTTAPPMCRRTFAVAALGARHIRTRPYTLAQKGRQNALSSGEITTGRELDAQVTHQSTRKSACSYPERNSLFVPWTFRAFTTRRINATQTTSSFSIAHLRAGTCL